MAFDYPGYGESEFAAEATRDDFAAAVFAGMDALEIDRAHICGLSLGGVVAIAMHAAAPERCASLIIADSFAVHPDGQGIHDRSVAASQAMTMRELAEARAGLLLGSATTRTSCGPKSSKPWARSIPLPTALERLRCGWRTSAIGPKRSMSRP